MDAALARIDRPIFVVGPPRSGTTLMMVILTRHADVHISTETHLLDIWAERHALLEGDRETFEAFWTEFTAWEPFSYLELSPTAITDRLARWRRWDLQAVLAALLDATLEHHGVSRVGEKTPDHAHHLDTLLAFHPDARVLFLLRDPRSTVASELRLDADWASDSPTVAAERWRRNASQALRWEADRRVMPVRFENFVMDPRRELATICEFLELPWDDRLLVDEGGHESYRHGVRDPWAGIDAGSATDWEGVLDDDALQEVGRICGDVARRLGYPDPLSSLPVGVRLRSVARRSLRRMVAAK